MYVICASMIFQLDAASESFFRDIAADSLYKQESKVLDTGDLERMQEIALDRKAALRDARARKAEVGGSMVCSSGVVRNYKRTYLYTDIHVDIHTLDLHQFSLLYYTMCSRTLSIVYAVVCLGVGQENNDCIFKTVGTVSTA